MKGRKLCLTEQTFPFQLQQEYQKRGHIKVLNMTSWALVLRALPLRRNISTAHIGIHEWAHTKSTVKRRRHKSANTLMQTDTHTNPCSPEQTHSHVSVHTQHCTFCPSIGLSIANYDSCVLILPLPPPHPRPAYHIADVSLPINAHRAALQWSWRVPQQQSTVEILQTCMYVPAEQNAVGGGGGTESKGRRAVNMSSQADRTAVCHTGTYSRMKTHVGVYTQRGCAFYVVFFTQMRMNI